MPDVPFVVVVAVGIAEEHGSGALAKGPVGVRHARGQDGRSGYFRSPLSNVNHPPPNTLPIP